MVWDYDLIVIGGGIAGMTASSMGSSFGAKTLLIDKNKLGGDYAWYGSFPRKILLHQARLAALGVPVDFDKITEKLHAIRNDFYEGICHPDKIRAKGVFVEEGFAVFTDPNTIRIEKKNGEISEVTGRYIIIATGSQVYVPPVPGIGDTPFLTSQTLFDLQHLPESMVIVGAGPVGTEIAQAYQRMGTRVTLVDMADRILGRDLPEMADKVKKNLEKEGVVFRLGMSVGSISGDEHMVHIMITGNDTPDEVIESEKLLFASGRHVLLDTLNLDAAGIAYTNREIPVNNFCRTNRRHIYAVGDVTGRYQFTHMSDHMARVAVHNALLKIPKRIDDRSVPWVINTDPEIGHVGATRAELEQKGVTFTVYQFPYSMMDRALTDEAAEGWIHIYATKMTGKILGADIVGAHAGEMISQFALAMKNRISLKKMADTIYPYSSYVFGMRLAADQWYFQKKNRTLLRWIRRIFRFRGPLPEPTDPG